MGFFDNVSNFLNDRTESFEREVTSRQRTMMDKVNDAEERGVQWGEHQEAIDNFKEKAHKNGIY